MKAQEAIRFYKSNDGFQLLTREIKSEKSGAESNSLTAEHLKNLTQYLNSTEISKDIKVYRGDSLKIAGLITLADGQKLDEAMKKACNELKEDPQAVNNLIDKVLDGDYVLNQERFMSTSINKGNAFTGVIQWELSIPAGTKGAFLENFNTKTNFPGEMEVLIQRDSKITIKDMSYNEKTNEWMLKAEVSTPPRT